MAVTPLDLQTNMGQISEVSRAEHARVEITAELHEMLKKKSKEETLLKKSKLEETGREDKLTGPDEYTGQSGKKKFNRGEESSQDNGDENSPVKDGKLGLFIDVLK